MQGFNHEKRRDFLFYVETLDHRYMQHMSDLQTKGEAERRTGQKGAAPPRRR